MGFDTYAPSTGDFGTAWLLAIIVPLIFALVLGIVQIIVTVWVYKNAKKNNIDSPGLWALLCFFIPFPIGLIIYIVVRNGKKKEVVSGGKFCPTCGTAVNGPGFCPSCGGKV
ncbi:MAG: zinc ribbon domain-containing protein [Eubacteriales bacterium]|nr:zinc ribbon domain-containing protein [Eubacteriales bacterium]MDD4474707.1 zinc ribbon domain-containing protein [Eubacteriales bacterium]